MTVSPDHARANNLPYTEMLSATIQAIDDARGHFNIESRLIMVGARHLGVEIVEKTAQTVVENLHPYVVGFGLAGDEINFPPGQFKRAFEIITEAGLQGTAHAGEVKGTESVREAITELPITRIGHGVRAIEDENLIQEMIGRDITLEIYPSSNIALKIYPDFATHPFLTLYRAGVKVTLNSDDPFFSDTTIANEYEIAKNIFGLNDEALLGITRTAIENIFTEETLKTKLLSRVYDGGAP